MSVHPKKHIAVILAAGMGTRMKSQHPKALQRLGNQPMILHLIQTIQPLFDKILVVVGPAMEGLQKVCAPHQTIIQKERKGTGHAAQIAVTHLDETDADVTFLYADNPLLTEATVQKLLSTRHDDICATLLTMRPQDPKHYGRVKLNHKNHIERIIEYKDASEEERALSLCNAGPLSLPLEKARKYLAQLTPQNSQNEYYLTDIIEYAAQEGVVLPIEADEREVIGINTRAELAIAEHYLQQRLREKALEQGVTLVDPASIFLSIDTEFANDVIIEPHVYIGKGVSLGKNTLIRSFSHLEECIVEEGAIIGPYARLRPGAHCKKNSHVGNFVELKNTILGEGSKANHLSYLGDTC